MSSGPPSFLVWMESNKTIIEAKAVWNDKINAKNREAASLLASYNETKQPSLRDAYYIAVKELSQLNADYQTWLKGMQRQYDIMVFQGWGIVSESLKASNPQLANLEYLKAKARRVDAATAVGVGAGTVFALLMLKRGMEDGIRALGSLGQAWIDKKQESVKTAADVVIPG